MTKCLLNTKWWSWFLLTTIFLTFSSVYSQSNINQIGSFEQGLPSYWKKGKEPGGTTLTWATDQFKSMGRSLKIEKTGKGEEAYWESENMADLWSPIHNKDVDIFLGAYVRTENVNINPANEDEKWYLLYTFYGKTNNLIGELKLPIDQTKASSGGWAADTNKAGQTILPEDSYTTIIKFVGGKNATGTVWADDFMFYGRGGKWAGQDWNTGVGVPTGWFYWLPPIGGNDGKLTFGYEKTKITDEAAYHGRYSLKFEGLEGKNDGFVGTIKYPLGTDVKAGDKLRISVWLKGQDLDPANVTAVGDQAMFAITPIFHDKIGNNEGWGEKVASDIPLRFPSVTAFDWKQYYVDVTVPADVKALTVRLHPLGKFKGTLYCDNLTVEKLDIPQISEIGSFEQGLPSYWKKGKEPGGTTLTWATDQFKSMGRSLKIEKTGKGEEAYWESENMADLWSPIHNKDVDIFLGAYVRTENVNINPANEDEKWYLLYTFYGKTNNLIGELKLPIDQTKASSGGWAADTNKAGQTILPEDSYTTIIKFVGGKNATGTVWADDFMFYGRGGKWAGQDWNTGVGVPTGWFYWLPPIGGNDGKLTFGYEKTKITDEAAYHGRYSLKFEGLEGKNDGFVGTIKYPLGTTINKSTGNRNYYDITDLKDVRAGDIIRISVWLKGQDLDPANVTAVGDQAMFAITPIFHDKIGNNEGWGEKVASDIPLRFPSVTAFDWKQYYVDVTVPANVKALTVRLHPLGKFKGTLYCDALEVKRMDLVSVNSNKLLPSEYNLFQNYPNPFNPTTIISYALPKISFVTMRIYDVLGREVKTLINQEQAPGIHRVEWKGDNNYGSKIASGTYIYRIEAGDFSQTKKMIFLK